MVCALLSHGHHVTTSCDITYCDCDLWPWSCDTFPHSPLYSKSKEKKRNINNDLAVLPSHNTTLPLKFSCPKNFLITCGMGQPCCPSCHHHLLFTLLLLIFLVWFLLLPQLFPLFFFFLLTYLSIASNFFPIFPNILGHISYLTTQTIFLLWTSLAILPSQIFLLSILVSPHLLGLVNTLSQILLLLPLHSLNSLYLPKYLILL